MAEQGGAYGGGGTGTDASGGDPTRGGGNGGVRGRGSFRNEIIYTRPQAITTKQGMQNCIFLYSMLMFNFQGSTGQPIRLLCNYFQLLQAGKWGLNQYRVDFNPDVDHTGQRKGYMKTAMQDVLNGYLFDGTVMYTPARLHPDPLEKIVQSDSGENIRVTVRLVSDLEWGDRAYLQLFNLIIRKCLTYMKLQLVGRDYYDPNAKVCFSTIICFLMTSNANIHKFRLVS